MAKYSDWLTDEGLLLIGGWAKDGLTDEQISANMGIAYSTFREWKKKYPAFLAVLKENKEVADRHVENAMYKAAVGFYYQEETVTNQGAVVSVRKYSKPNVTAGIFWLKNRNPEHWRDRQEIEQTLRTVEIKVGEWDED